LCYLHHYGLLLCHCVIYITMGYFSVIVLFTSLWVIFLSLCYLHQYGLLFCHCVIYITMGYFSVIGLVIHEYF